MERHELPRRPVALDDGLRVLVVDLEPPLDRVGAVVMTRLLVRAGEQALERDLVRDVEEEHCVEPSTDLREHRVELLRLREVSREPVEDEARCGVRLRQPLANEGDGQLVGNELAGREDRLHPAAELRPGRDRGAEHVAGRDVWDAVLGREPLRLRPLAGALRAQHQEVHRRKPS